VFWPGWALDLLAVLVGVAGAVFALLVVLLLCWCVLARRALPVVLHSGSGGSSVAAALQRCPWYAP